MTDTMTADRQVRAQVLLSRKKSMGMALLLALLFGPLGMFYATILGAIVMIVLNMITLPLTAGLAGLVTWPIGLIWTGVAVKLRNDALERQALAA